VEVRGPTINPFELLQSSLLASWLAAMFNFRIQGSKSAAKFVEVRGPTINPFELLQSSLLASWLAAMLSFRVQIAGMYFGRVSVVFFFWSTNFGASSSFPLLRSRPGNKAFAAKLLSPKKNSYIPLNNFQ